MKKITLFLAVVIFSNMPHLALGQMVIDPSFAEATLTNGGLINKVVILPDGKFFAGGLFSEYNDVAVNSFSKANADGTIDAAFNVNGGGTNSPTNFYRVVDAAVDADGKIYVVGGFNSFNGVSRHGLVRLNVDGTVDTSFAVDPEFDDAAFGYFIDSVKPTADGKVLIAGIFSYDFPEAESIDSFVRLNSDGSLDTTFPANGNYGSGARLIEVQSDGKILLEGGDGVLTRLHADGTIDVDFESLISGSINVIFSQPDGSIFVGGSITFSGQETPVGIVKLNNDGTINTTFETHAVALGAGSGFASDIKVYNEKLLVAGRFDSYGDVVINSMVLLNTDGTVDSSFSVGSGFNSTVSTIVITGDNKIIAGGRFTQFNNTGVNPLIRLMETDLGLKDFEQNKIVVYNNNGIHFKSSVSEIKSIEIYDLSGRIVYTADDIDAFTHTVELNNKNQLFVADIRFDTDSKIRVKIHN